MNGYTDGVAQNLSEQSMEQGLNIEFVGDVKSDFSNLEELLKPYVDLDKNKLQELKETKEICLNDYDDIATFIDEDTMKLYIEHDWYGVFNDLSEGGLLFITDMDKNVLGVKLGAAGEHLGQVSVWVDSYKGVITQGGKDYPLSENDRQELDEIADTIYND